MGAGKNPQRCIVNDIAGNGLAIRKDTKARMIDKGNARSVQTAGEMEIQIANDLARLLDDAPKLRKECENQNGNGRTASDVQKWTRVDHHGGSKFRTAHAQATEEICKLHKSHISLLPASSPKKPT